MRYDSSSTLYADLKGAYHANGVRGALAFLNAQTPHRFTSLYRFDNETLRNVTFFDRQNPEVERSEDVSIEASYCIFIRDRGIPMSVTDSETDERLLDHPKRPIVRRYAGVPLVDGMDKVIGSVCHFDFEPGEVTTQDMEQLEYLARLLQPHVS